MSEELIWMKKCDVCGNKGCRLMHVTKPSRQYVDAPRLQAEKLRADRELWLQIYCAVFPLLGREDPESFPAVYADYPPLCAGAVRRTDQLFEAYKKRWSDGYNNDI